MDATIKSCHGRLARKIRALAALPAERFFRTSLSLLILTSVLTLVSTGKLDVFTIVAGPLAALIRAIAGGTGAPPNSPPRGHVVRARVSGVSPRGYSFSFALFRGKFFESSALRGAALGRAFFSST